MRTKPLRIVFAPVFVVAFSFCLAAAAGLALGVESDGTNVSPLRIHLPREVEVKNDCFTLGQISVIRGAEELVERCGQVGLGKISLPGQRIVIERATILSRLASSGMPASMVSLTGAEEVVVKDRRKIITGDEFVGLALSFLKDSCAEPSVCGWQPVTTAEDMALPRDVEDMKVVRNLTRSSTRSRPIVEAIVLADGKRVGSRDVRFRTSYSCHRVVTVTDLTAGEVITPDNVRIEQHTSNNPEQASWRPPYGSVLRRSVLAEKVLSASMLRLPEPDVVIERNQSVVIRVESPGLVVTALGTALEKGAAGEHIKVRNCDSQRVVIARIKDDGSVEPVL